MIMGLGGIAVMSLDGFLLIVTEQGSRP